MKKLMAVVGTMALLVVMAGPVMAKPHYKGDDISIKNSAVVGNAVVSVANSGVNSISGLGVFNTRIKTGSAVSYTGLLNQVNYNEVGCFGCHDDLSIKNRAFVGNLAVSVANSGVNSISGMGVGCSAIRTGYAGSSAVVENLVNTNVVGGMPNPPAP